MVSLQDWIDQAREHWKDFQPKRYSALEKAGKLEAALRHAAELTAKEMRELRAMGYSEQEAWEMARETCLFPPGERPGFRRSDSPFWKPPSNLTDVLHEAIKSGARTVEIPHASFTLSDLKKALKGE